jgi:hypothetical protein
MNQEYDYSQEAIAEPQADSLTNAEIAVDATSQSINDFLEDEQRRANDRKRYINLLVQKMAQNETAHQRAIAEQNELHAHSQAKLAEQLKMLGYHEPTLVAPPAAAPVDRMAKARAARKAKAVIAAPAPAGAPAKGKRVMSAETRAKMSAARAAFWSKKQKAAKKSKAAAK